MQQSDAPSLWVCWRKPATEIPPGTVVLSFLPPDVEEELAKTTRIERARELSQEIRIDARRAYLDIVAAIGIADCGGKTFRQRLEDAKGASRWWYHRVAFRDCEYDPTFNRIIAILTIGALADRIRPREIVLAGAASEVVSVLRSRFRVRDVGTIPESTTTRALAAIARRIRNLIQQSGYSLLAIPLPAGRIGAFLGAFWDWSIDLLDGGTIRDRYFGNLPEEIERRGAGPVGWLVWIDGTKKTPLARARSLANRGTGSDRFVCLQSLLALRDIFAAHADFQPLRKYLRYRSNVRRAATWRDYDFGSLFMNELLGGFLDQSLPNAELVTIATERATSRYSPSSLFSFLEHFPHARAMYRGVGDSVTTFAVQHASYNSDKTFLSLEPRIEFPEVPHPDFACAMGELGRSLFLNCGYSDAQVLLTGSPRYDGLRKHDFPVRHPGDGSVNILMVATLNVPMELEMIRAVAAAAQDLPAFKLRLRCHPARPIPAKDAAACSVEITRGSLEEDLNSADLVLFSYSTVAEEAYIGGKPAWQWLPLGFDGSALAEVASIPRFGSVAALRESLIAFAKDRNRFTPDPESRSVVFRQIFFRHDGAASRIADQLQPQSGLRKGSAS